MAGIVGNRWINPNPEGLKALWGCRLTRRALIRKVSGTPLSGPADHQLLAMELPGFFPIFFFLFAPLVGASTHPYPSSGAIRGTLTSERRLHRRRQQLAVIRDRRIGLS